MVSRIHSEMRMWAGASSLGGDAELKLKLLSKDFSCRQGQLEVLCDALPHRQFWKLQFKTDFDKSLGFDFLSQLCHRGLAEFQEASGRPDLFPYILKCPGDLAKASRLAKHGIGTGN